MARKRNGFGPQGEARFLALVGQGWTAKAIAEDLNASGITVSRSTIDTRMREVRGHVATPRGKGVTPPVTGCAPSDAGEDDAPSGELPTEADVDAAEAELEAAAKTGPEAVAALIRRFETMVSKADAAKNYAIAARIGSLLKELHSLQSRLTPPARPDPNDQPDMAKLGAEVEQRYLKMIDLVAEEYDSRAA